MIYHFVGQGYKKNAQNAIELEPGDLAGDLEFLFRAAKKVEAIREDLGKVGPVISTQVTEAMLGRRKRLNTEHAELEAAPARKMLSIQRDMDNRLKRLHEQLNETKRELHLDPESIESVVRTGLALAGQQPLIETTLPGLWPDSNGKRTRCPVFQIPILNGSWRSAAVGLEHPHTHKIRPIVFDHTLISGRDDVVLVHLNHRLVQSCLQRIRAEIWSSVGHHRLHRITARLIPNKYSDVPLVIAHGRLVVLGGDNQRLHEEIIFAGGELREGRFARIPQVSRIEEVLYGATNQMPSEQMLEKLKLLWPNHEENLRRSLEARMKDRTETLQSRLDERANSDVTTMRTVLSELLTSIRTQLADVQPQLELFSTPEKEQFERDRGALNRRAAELPNEMDREEQLIRARYAHPSARLFPVSVTYLVPEALEKMGGQ